MLHIGAHLSSAKGYLAMGKEALSMKADTFQFFTRNPRGGAAKEINKEDVSSFRTFASDHHFTSLIAHAPYTLNACGKEERVRAFAIQALSEDLARTEFLPGNYYNFHPGSHVGQGIETGIQKIAEVLNMTIRPEQSTTVLLETMAGKGSEVGSRFEQLRTIMDRTNYSEKLGICLDTCHVYDAGYDIVNHLDDVLEEFDHIIGLSRLKAVHLADSKNPFASRKDRHETIGNGFIGLDAMIRIINHPALKSLPFILETPTDTAGHAKEIALLQKHYSE